MAPWPSCFIPCSRTRSTSIFLGSSGWCHKKNPTGGSTHPSHPSVLPPPLPPLLPALRSLVIASRRRFRRSHRWELGETPWKVAENRVLKLSWERISWSQNASKSPPVQKEPALDLWVKAKRQRSTFIVGIAPVMWGFTHKNMQITISYQCLVLFANLHPWYT